MSVFQTLKSSSFLFDFCGLDGSFSFMGLEHNFCLESKPLRVWQSQVDLKNSNVNGNCNPAKMSEMELNQRRCDFYAEDPPKAQRRVQKTKYTFSLSTETK